MAPKGSPRMLIAASLLVTDKTLSVKGALSKAGFSAEEIAKEKKQRQARRRRDFLLKKKATTKIKGKRTMSTLPKSMEDTQKINYNNQKSKRNAHVMINRKNNAVDSAGNNILNEQPNEEEDTSRMDALIFACSMQESLSAPFQSTTDSNVSIESSTSTASSESSANSTSSGFYNAPSSSAETPSLDKSATSFDLLLPAPSETSLSSAAELDNELNPIHFEPLQASSSEMLDFNIFSSL